MMELEIASGWQVFTIYLRLCSVTKQFAVIPQSKTCLYMNIFWHKHVPVTKLCLNFKFILRITTLAALSLTRPM